MTTEERLDALVAALRRYHAHEPGAWVRLGADLAALGPEREGQEGGEPIPTAALWGAINEYALACGGNPGLATIGDRRMDAVAGVERALSGLALGWNEKLTLATHRADHAEGALGEERKRSEGDWAQFAHRLVDDADTIHKVLNDAGIDRDLGSSRSRVIALAADRDHLRTQLAAAEKSRDGLAGEVDALKSEVAGTLEALGDMERDLTAARSALGEARWLISNVVRMQILPADWHDRKERWLTTTPPPEGASEPSLFQIAIEQRNAAQRDSADLRARLAEMTAERNATIDHATQLANQGLGYIHERDEAKAALLDWRRTDSYASNPCWCIVYGEPHEPRCLRARALVGRS